METVRIGPEGVVAGMVSDRLYPLLARRDTRNRIYFENRGIDEDLRRCAEYEHPEKKGILETDLTEYRWMKSHRRVCLHMPSHVTDDYVCVLS